MTVEYTTQVHERRDGKPDSYRAWVRDGKPASAADGTSPDGTARRIAATGQTATAVKPAPTSQRGTPLMEVEADVAELALCQERGRDLGRQWRGDAFAYARAERFSVDVVSREEVARRAGSSGIVGCISFHTRTISVASDISQREQQITVAHEMGHCEPVGEGIGDAARKEQLSEAFALAFVAAGSARN